MKDLKVQRRKRARAYLMSSDEFVRLYNTSSSLSEMLRKLGYKDTSTGTIAILKERIAIEKLKPIDGRFHRNSKALKDVLVENSSYSRKDVKRQLIKQNLLGAACSICHVEPVWNEKPLVLILDHINGVNNDNRIENLRLVCPNCNSQLSTFAGRNNKHQQAVC